MVVVLALSMGLGGPASGVGTRGQAQLVISNPEVREFSICSDFIVLTTLEFELSLIGDAGMVEVSYVIEHGTTDDADVSVGPGSISLSPDSGPAVVSVEVGIDDVNEADETVLLRVTDIAGARAPDGPAVGTIFDDDARFGRRFAGPTRVETSLAAWPIDLVVRHPTIQQRDAVLAGADQPLDAVLAAALGERVHLNAGVGLHPEIAAHMSIADPPRRVTLVGDEDALPAQVEADLLELGVGEVVRLSGADPAATAARVAAEVEPDGHAYIISDGAEVDGIVVSPLVAMSQTPILLIEGDAVPDQTRQALSDNGITSVTIVGGTAVVGESVEEELRSLGLDVSRLAGGDRWSTSVAVAEGAIERGLSPDFVWLASGRAPADIAAAGPAAGIRGGCYRPPAPLILIDGESLDGSPSSRDWLASRDQLTGVTIMGGTAVVTDAVASELFSLTGVERG